MGSDSWDFSPRKWVQLCGIYPPLTGFIYVGSDPPKLESVMWDRNSQNWGQVCGTQQKEAAEYLNACMSDSEEVFLLALRDVVEASGGMANLARKTSLNRENLYRSLSKKGNPKLSSLASILDAVGIHLLFAPTKKQKKAA